MTEQEHDRRLHAESERLRTAMLALADELSDVVGDLRKLLAETQGGGGDGRAEGQAR